MLNKNPGLRDVCHSITGGALVAQGKLLLQKSRLMLTFFRLLDTVCSCQGYSRHILLRDSIRLDTSVRPRLSTTVYCARG